jgi:hypothetical protein
MRKTTRQIMRLGTIPSKIYPATVWKKPVKPTKIELTVRNVDNFLNAFDTFEIPRSTEKTISSMNMDIMLSFIYLNSTNIYYINKPNSIGFLMQTIH